MNRSILLPAMFTILSTVAVAQPAATEKHATERVFGADRFVAGGTARVDNPVAGDLIAAGGHVDIDAPINGDALVAGGHVRLGGKLRYRGRDLQRDPAAQVTGGVEHVESPGKAHGEARYRWGGWLWTAGLMVLAAIVAGALPAFSARVTAAFRAQPWLALLFGFIALVCIPIAALLLMITIIGLPLGLLA